MKLKLLGFNSGLRKEFRFSFALQVLGADENVADESIGFHAQQAVEKCLKAVLMGLVLLQLRTEKGLCHREVILILWFFSPRLQTLSNWPGLEPTFKSQVKLL